MKCYRTAREFAKAVCVEKGQWRPTNIHYLVRDLDNVVRKQARAPRSYRKVKEVLVSVDDDRFATRRFGVWVEELASWDEDWLMQRQLKQAVDKLSATRDIYDAPDNVDPEVAQKLTGYPLVPLLGKLAVTYQPD